jgi:hypothetical protein
MGRNPSSFGSLISLQNRVEILLVVGFSVFILQIQTDIF